MAEHINLDEVLSKNPQIDPEKLEESRELLHRLRERGTRRKSYELANPYGGQRVGIRDDSRSSSVALPSREDRS